MAALAVVDACRAADIFGIDERLAAVVERIILGTDCRQCVVEVLPCLGSFSCIAQRGDEPAFCVAEEASVLLLSGGVALECGVVYRCLALCKCVVCRAKCDTALGHQLLLDLLLACLELVHGCKSAEECPCGGLEEESSVSVCGTCILALVLTGSEESDEGSSGVNAVFFYGVLCNLSLLSAVLCNVLLSDEIAELGKVHVGLVELHCSHDRTVILITGEVVVPVGIEHDRDTVEAVCPDLGECLLAVLEDCSFGSRHVLLGIGIGDNLVKECGVAGFLDVLADGVDEPDGIITGMEVQGSGGRDIEVMVCAAVGEHLLADVLDEGPCLGTVGGQAGKDVLKDVAEAEAILETGVVAALHAVEVENHCALVLDPLERRGEQLVAGYVEAELVEVLLPLAHFLFHHALGDLDVGELGSDGLELLLVLSVVVVRAACGAEDGECLLSACGDRDVEANH